MNDRVLVRQRDGHGKIRIYVLPIETELGFQDLITFVSQECGCKFGDPDKGPGTIVRKGIADGKGLVFVLSDSTGAQFFAETEDGLGIAERIAESIETRLREVMG